MSNNTSSDQNERQLRRTVSLEPTMSSSEREDTNRTSVHTNPLFVNNEANEERNSSLRRHVSEPARNHNRIVSNVVTRAQSIRSMVMRGTQQFFGISDENSDDELWRQRCRRLMSKHGKIRDRMSPIDSTGFDETDGIAQNNRISDPAETQRPMASDLIKEDISRSPALKVTLKAIVLASNTLKKKFSNRNRQIENQEVREEEEPPVCLRSQSYEIDDEISDEDENFFDNVESPEEDELDGRPPANKKWNIQRQVSVKDKSIPEKLIEAFLATDNSNRRKLGMGFIDRLLDRRLKKNLSPQQRQAIDDHIDDFRPYFTYWITTVQILILFISLIVYGVGHWGFGFEHISGLVYVESRSLQQVDYYEPQNFWIGPRSADLIHLGAKYTPCMRRDHKIFDIINEERSHEKTSGCCIRNDGSGCVQTQDNRCSQLLSTWHKWNPSDPRASGPVCGQDPSYCQQPASIQPYEWADDITKWPICTKKTDEVSLSAPHMNCELIARPCCLGVYGQCHITTRDYCDFIKGFFHEEATLCSQVSCMENVCGMIPFYSNDSPDQFYRIWTPIFLHAGFGHLLITVVFHYFIMRDIEKMTGPVKMAIIYMASGIGGYLMSAVFLPFRPEVGPAGSLYGVLACLFAEVINLWDVYEQPIRPLLKLILVACILFLLGLLPWIDNYAHIGGFVIGLLLSLALLPDVRLPITKQTDDERNHKRRNRIITVISCLSTVVIIFIVLFCLLYWVPIYDIKFFKYLNCIPFTSDWCANQDIQINRVDIL